MIKLKNFGKSSAIITNIQYNNEIPEYLEKYFESFKEKSLMPGEVSSCVILPDSYEKKINLEYSYKSLNTEEKEKLYIDLDHTSRELYTKVEKFEGFENELLTAFNHLYRKL